MTTDHELLGGIIAEMDDLLTSGDPAKFRYIQEWKDSLQSLLGGGWQDISTAPVLKSVLIHYKNKLGNSRIIKARFVPRFTVETNSDSDEIAQEYEEANDRYTLQEGWYEVIDNWDDFSSVLVNEGNPDAWHPLPLKPTGEL